LVSFITIYVTEIDKERDTRKATAHQDSLSNIDYNYKKAQLLQEFMPAFNDTDTLKERIAILSFYLVDSTFAIETALVLNTKGTIRALNTISLNKSRAVGNRIAMNTQNSSSASAGEIALKNAFGELSKAKQPGNDADAQTSKYLRVVNATLPTGWSAAFIIWCFQQGQVNKLNIQTPDLTKFFKTLKAKEYILDPSANVKVGDIVFFNFQENKGIEQCGIVYSQDSDYVYTIEADNDGEAVSTRIRYKADAMAFARIP
jgi:hypothetical protein